jgi:hypothetical protein
MNKKLLILMLLLTISVLSSGQTLRRSTFGGTGSSNNNNQTSQQSEDDKNQPRTPPFTLKRYFRSLAGKDSMNISRMWIGSAILPGSAQIYNREYWKLPVIYGGLAGMIYGGSHFEEKYSETGEHRYKTYSSLFYAGALITYWGSMLDGVANFKYHKPVLPARASLYSALLPGLGQAYNGTYWKIPIIYGGFITCGYFISFNNTQFLRYKTLYVQAAEGGSDQRYSLETLKYFKDTYRRYRDYSILCGVAVYALNIIDANVFAHLQDFDISDDLSASFSPAIMQPVNYSYNTNINPSVGVRMCITF